MQAVALAVCTPRIGVRDSEEQLYSGGGAIRCSAMRCAFNSIMEGTMMRLRSLAYSIIAALAASSAGGAADDPYAYTDERLTVRLTPRTPQQMAAFYEARGFQPAMIDVVSAQCFITVLIKNTSADIVWLDLAQWTFHDADGRLERRHRDDWRRQWQVLDIPLAHQSTFRWTLLPERLDFRPGEHEGGNIILPRTGRPITISARFDAGTDRSGKPILVELNNVRCAEDE